MITPATLSPKEMSVARFSAKDDLLHPIAPDVPHGRESFAWAVPVPREGLLAFLYTARDADTGPVLADRRARGRHDR